METTLKVMILIFILLALSCNKEDERTDTQSDFVFPEIDYIDTQAYNEIKLTCEKYWELNSMIDSTFKIVQDEDEYLIQCDGYLDGKLYLFIIRTDKNGKWINDGRILKDEIKSFNVELIVTNLIYYPNDYIPVTFIIASTNGKPPYTYHWIKPDTLVGEGPFTIDVSNNLLLELEVEDSVYAKVKFLYEIRRDTIDPLKYDYRNAFIGLYDCEVIHSWAVDSNGIYIRRDYDIYQDTIEVSKHNNFRMLNIFNLPEFGPEVEFNYIDSTFECYHTYGKFQKDGIELYTYFSPAALVSWSYKGKKIK